MDFGKKCGLQKMKTVSQFGHFGGIFSSLLGSLDKGGIPKVFPPNMKKVPHSADSGARWDPLARFDDM